MPFIVYKKKGDKLKKEKKVSLAGYGAIYSLAKSKYSNVHVKEEEGIGWEITEKEIIKELGFDPELYRLIIDLKPSVKGNISFYYLRRIFGYSYYGWTPIALQLETIFVDEYPENPEKFKQEFQVPSEKGDIVHEFLYLQGGFKEGNWVWGRVGSINGCLLWSDALRFFMEKISPYIK